MNSSYLKFFKPEGLLAAADWPKNRPDSFFAERFLLEVPSPLVPYLFPGLAALNEQVILVFTRGTPKDSWH